MQLTTSNIRGIIHSCRWIHINQQKPVNYMYASPCQLPLDTYKSAKTRQLYVCQTLPTADGYI